MKKTMMKTLVAILVLAMLIQVPFALSASANTLSQNSSLAFTVNEAENNTSGNVEVKLFANTIATEKITTFAATLVIDVRDFDILDDDGNVITSRYLVDSIKLGDDFPMAATPINEGASFKDLEGLSLASYNSTTHELFLCIQGQSLNGSMLSGNTELATFYLQTKNDSVYDEVIPPVKNQNIRLMRADEYKTSACPSPAIVPGELSSKNHIFTALAEDLVTDMDLTVNFVTTGVIQSGVLEADNKNAEITIVAQSDKHTYTKTSTGDAAFSLDEVKPGTYTVTITCDACLGYTVTNVVVTKGQTSTLPQIKLVFGDYVADSSEAINIRDISGIITQALAYNHTDVRADVNGDQMVRLDDVSKAITNYGYAKDMMKSVWSA